MSKAHHPEVLEFHRDARLTVRRRPLSVQCDESGMPRAPVAAAIGVAHRLAHSEVLPDEKGTTCAAFPGRATEPLCRPRYA